MPSPNKPKLRQIDFRPVEHQGQQMWYLHDPMQLTQHQLVMPPALAQMLIFCDGTRTEQEIHAAFCQHVGSHVAPDVVSNTLNGLDDALLLENERSKQALQALLDAYRAQPHRPPALADLSYPAQPQELAELFQSYSVGDNREDWQPWNGRGIISPHIDYQRGGAVYAKVWQRAQTAVSQADLVVILGTDHNGGLGSLTLTRQAYATPYGVLPTDLELVDKLTAAITPEAAFAAELNHRDEHSIELSAVWLHHIYQQNNITPKPMVPILVGSFHHFVMGDGHPEKDAGITAVIETLQREMAHKKVLFVASVDLAHVGPIFDDDFVMDKSRREELEILDRRLMETAVQANAASWYNQIANIQDRNRICGFSPVYILLRILGASTGHPIAYDQCPADPQNNSLVSICSLLID